MKKIVTLFAFVIMATTAFSQKKESNCNLAVTYAEMAAKNFKEARKSEATEEAKAEALKKGIQNASEASAYAISENCNCGNTKNYALNAVTFAKKAQKANDSKQKDKLIKKALDASFNVVTAAAACKIAS